MTDDIWRNDDAADPSAGGRRPGRFEASMDEFDDEEFGGPLFGDDSGGAKRAHAGGATGENAGLELRRRRHRSAAALDRTAHR